MKPKTEVFIGKILAGSIIVAVWLMLMVFTTKVTINLLLSPLQ